MGERGGRVAPKLKLGPQNYFPGAGAVIASSWHQAVGGRVYKMV